MIIQWSLKVCPPLFFSCVCSFEECRMNRRSTDEILFYCFVYIPAMISSALLLCYTQKGVTRRQMFYDVAHPSGHQKFLFARHEMRDKHESRIKI